MAPKTIIAANFQVVLMILPLNLLAIYSLCFCLALFLFFVTVSLCHNGANPIYRILGHVYAQSGHGGGEGKKLKREA